MYYGEKLNSISHLVGAVFALIALGSLLTVGIQTGDPLVITGFSAFGVSMVLLYTMSALYHGFNPPGIKHIFKILDHVSIYLLIAGTYTPFMLVTLRDSKGYLILGVVWGLAVIGILSEVFLSGRAIKVAQIIIYLTMGWVCSLDLGGLKAALPGSGFYWLLAGGLAYTAGIAFYLIDKLKRLNYSHGIWHLFVLAGSVFHFITVIGFVR
jgi:hemolysin III